MADAPCLTIRCEYPDSAPTEVTFGLSPSYGIRTARDAHDWFLYMMPAYDELETTSGSPGLGWE